MIPNEIAGGQGPGSAVSFDFQKRMLHDDPSTILAVEGGEHVAKGTGMRKEKKKPKKKK